MLEVFSAILLIILVSKFLEDKTKVPFVLIVIILAYIADTFLDLSTLGNNFEEIIYLMLPIILIPDVLGLSRSELKENAGDIFYLAFVAVIVSIALAVGATFYVDTKYHFSLFELLIVFTPLMATDVISVSAIFAKFKLPQKLKLYAEGESLFNDITAMLIFFFIALPILHGDNLDFATLTQTTIYTVVISAVIGVVMGLVGYYSFKISQNSFEEFLSIYVMASMAFLVADKMQLSGILSVVISVLLFKFLFDKEGHYKKRNYNAIIKHLNTPSSLESSFRAYKKEAYYLGQFANAVIFIAIANVIDLDLLLKYKVEILYVFTLTTIIRYIVIVPLVKYRKLSLLWNNILTLSGMKGGLALIMIVSLSDNFVYKEMFLAVVLGVVILSIFFYTIVLMAYLYTNKDKLISDTAKEHHLEIKNVQDLLQKEQLSKAYNEMAFEDIVEKEIQRAQRYKYDFSLMAFQTDALTAHQIYKKLVRKSDYFGKINAQTYAILLTHNDVDNSLEFANKIKEHFTCIEHIAIAQYTTGDSVEMLFDKLYAALSDDKAVDVEI
ncbi:cation:proton antiporter [Sulfurimonas autotrophica]|uniref:Sodium/proton antiporter, CPA1 family n=1 Tax=Sulfurimonas autotrophica (strain ATCC BAA-671 / DSM 16294 / JCM 11897 / OK10) TaxID=563040 RepID=E0UP79_SULAO|nr:cation:proton antiporter [Sulfurimonas autotrophica]ADN08543.1 sodium/proton antiporter, CPA1 family [Sulfurimonas autotrophica DSM 16294]